MSHLNNQGQNPGQGYNNNPNYKRNLNNRNMNPNIVYQYSQNPYPEQYINAYPGYQQPYGYAPQGYVVGQPYVSHPQKQHVQHHQINLTNQSGEKVDLKALSSTTPKSSYATLNKYTSSSPTHKKTPSVTSVASTPAASEAPAKNSLAEQFKLQVAAKAAKAKAESEASKKLVAEPKPEAKEEVKETPKEEAKEEKKEEVKDTSKEEVKEQVKEEVKEQLKEELNEEAKKEVVAEPVTEEKKEESKPESTETPAVESSDEKVKSSIPETIEESSKEEDNEDVFSISKFFNVLQNAKPIEDPFSFKYPEGFVGPDSKLNVENVPKLRYDPIFLTQFASLVKFPTDKQFKEQIKFIEQDQGRNERSGSSRGGSNYRNFGQGSKSSSNLRKFDSINSRSNSRQGSKRRGGSSRNDRKSNRFSRDRGEREEKEPEIPIDVKPLEKSANRWIPKSRAAKVEEVKYAPDGVTVLLSETEIARKAKSLLNKLTLEYFDEISDELIEIANQSKWEDDGAVVKQVLEITFDKAVDEPHWSAMYAQFCAKLCKTISPEVKDASIPDREGNPSGGPSLVRKYLITKCQSEYEKGWSEDLPTNEDGTPLEPEMLTDEYYRIAALKRRGLGLVRLIGHLFDLGLLKEAVILSCLRKLIQNETPTDDVVENLIQFVKTIGKKLDSNQDTRGKLSQIFETMKTMSTNPKIPRRLQFALMDLIDLRNQKWQGGDADKGPKTIKEIHEEENKKYMEEQRQKSERKRGGNNDSRSNSSRNSTWSSSNRVNETDFQKVGRVGAPSSSPLGPQNYFSGKGKHQKQQTNDASTPSTSSPLAARENSIRGNVNSFHLLNEHDDEEEEEEHEEEKEVAGKQEVPTNTTEEESKE